MMKWLNRLIGFILIVYVLICGLAFFQQEKMIFRLDKLDDSFSFWTGEEVFLSVDDGVDLHAMWLRTPNAKGVILYWHGNRGSNRRCLRQAEGLFGLGYDVFMPDYRGYGKSDGEIHSEEQLFADAQAVYDWLLEYYDENQVVLLGYSLGSGVATFLAEENKPRHLCLVAPYLSMVAMKDMMIPFVPSFLLKYKLDNTARIGHLSCEVHLFHGTNDELIPHRHSEELQRLKPKGSRLISIRNTGHRGAIFSPVLRENLVELLR